MNQTMAVFLSVLAASLLWMFYSIRIKRHAWPLAVIPSTGVVILTLIFYKILWSVFDEQNWIRLKNTFLIASGHQLYYGPHEGPVLTTIYGPLSALVYLPAVLFSNPQFSLLAGVSIAILLYFAPAVWLHLGSTLKYGRPAATNWIGLAFFCYFTFFFSSLKVSAFLIHADAPALGFGAAACACIYFRRNSGDSRLLFLSALFAACSVWSKQVSVPLYAALPLFVFLTEPRSVFIRYGFFLALTGLGLSLVFLAAFDPQPMLFQMFTIPSHHHLRDPFIPELLHGFFKILRDCCIMIPALFFSILQLRRDISKQLTARALFREHRWMIFILTGLFMTPVTLLSSAKIGGSNNTLSFSTYYLLLGFSLGFLKGWQRSLRLPAAISFHKPITWLKPAAALMAVSLLSVHIPIAIYRIRNYPPSDNFAEDAYHYIKRHPGESYFPRLSILHLLAEGEVYHSMDGLRDRKWSGIPLSQDHFNAHRPANLKRLFFRVGEYLQDLPYLKFKESEPDPELPNFRVFVPAD